jgi:hypothetical protein
LVTHPPDPLPFEKGKGNKIIKRAIALLNTFIDREGRELF